MIGNNTLKINQATMSKALTYWLSKKFLASDSGIPQVLKVREVKDGGTTQFEIEFKFQEPTPDDDKFRQHDIENKLIT